MVVALGLHFGFNAAHKYSMVQHFEQHGDRFVFVRNGRHDYVADVTQRHRKV